MPLLFLFFPLLVGSEFVNWLGHVSLNTTNVYAEVDLEMKAKALATCEVRGAVPPKHWKDDVALNAVPANPLIGIMWRRGPFACIPSQNRIPGAT